MRHSNEAAYRRTAAGHPPEMAPGPDAGRPFAALLAEAESVRDVVSVRHVLPALPAPPRAMRQAWEFFLRRSPWAAPQGAAAAAPRLRGR
jgi:hypothetical protein